MRVKGSGGNLGAFPVPGAYSLREVSMLEVCIVVVVIGILLWAATTYLPMSPPIRNILISVVVIGTVVYVLQAFGLIGSLDAVRIG